MEGDTSGSPVSGTVILVAVAYVATMLLAGLLTAFMRVNALYRNGLLEEDKVGRILHEYLHSSRRFLITVSTLYMGLTAVVCFGWGHLLLTWSRGAPTFRTYLVLALTFLVAWSLGGLLFKFLAARAALGYARWLGAMVLPLHWLLRPWTAALLWLMGKGDSTLWSSEILPQLSHDEIRSLLNEENGSVTLEEEEREMIHSIFSFHDTAVREIMIPRIDVVSLDASAPAEEAVPEINAARHSRIPVHDGSVDKVTGILYAKDLLALVEAGQLVAAGKVVGDLARPAYYIPESKKIDEVLAEFRTKRIHMAIVIDEYGGTAGIVTLEDVLEEIVGEIEDEFDQAERLFEWLDENSARVDAKIDLEDLQELVGIALPAEDCETLGGLIYDAAGKVPEAGEKVDLAELTVTVEKVDDQRIRQVVISSADPLPGYARREQ